MIDCDVMNWFYSVNEIEFSGLVNCANKANQ